MIDGRPITGRLVLIWLIAFFGVVFAVNGIFAYYALDTWPGLTSQHAYQEGLAYNKTLEAVAAQNAMHWQSTVSLSAAPVGKPAEVAVAITGPSGAAIGNLDVTLAMTRPLGDSMSTTVDLSDQGGGVYRGTVALPAAGRWYADIEARAGGSEKYRMRHELMVGE